MFALLSLEQFLFSVCLHVRPLSVWVLNKEKQCQKKPDECKSLYINEGDGIYIHHTIPKALHAGKHEPRSNVPWNAQALHEHICSVEVIYMSYRTQLYHKNVFIPILHL